jgi:hypothetical protein
VRGGHEKGAKGEKLFLRFHAGRVTGNSEVSRWSHPDQTVAWLESATADGIRLAGSAGLLGQALPLRVRMTAFCCIKVDAEEMLGQNSG